MGKRCKACGHVLPPVGVEHYGLPDFKVTEKPEFTPHEAGRQCTQCGGVWVVAPKRWGCIPPLTDVSEPSGVKVTKFNDPTEAAGGMLTPHFNEVWDFVRGKCPDASWDVTCERVESILRILKSAK